MIQVLLLIGRLNLATRWGPGVFRLGGRVGSLLCLFLTSVVAPIERWEKVIFAVCLSSYFGCSSSMDLHLPCHSLSQPVIAIDLIVMGESMVTVLSYCNTVFLEYMDVPLQVQ